MSEDERQKASVGLGMVRDVMAEMLAENNAMREQLAAFRAFVRAFDELASFDGDGIVVERSVALIGAARASRAAINPAWLGDH